MTRDTLLIVTTSYPQQGDGSEAAGAFVADLAEELATRIPVRVVAPGRRGGAVEQRNGVAVRRFAGTGKPLSLLSPTRPADWPAIVGTLRSMRAEVLASDGDGRVAHTLALWVLPSGWAAAALQRVHGVPYSVWALGSDIWSLGKLAVGRTMLRRVIRGATHRYADGLQLADDAARISGRPFAFLPSTRILPGTRTSPLASAPPYRLFFLGRWHPNKGIDLLLDALALLDARAWSRIAEVHVAGGGPMDAQVRAQVASLQASGRPVRLDGYMDRSQATQALADADWLLLPSRIESIPVVFSDAMKMGLPVVSMPVGDLPALVSKHLVGTVAARVDAPAFADAMARAMERSPSEFADGIATCAAEFELRPGALLSELGFMGAAGGEPG